ncbi:MAG: PRC-barrel domain-containing protein [Patescibacteria group bacterium]|nr:PRC-barrel domain-containing protein [Patescibacteria group bacterium]
MIGVPVRTKAGLLLGRLKSMDFDAETGKLNALHVKVRGPVPGLLDDELIIAWVQVISMGEDEIVVADDFAEQGAAKVRKWFALLSGTRPIVTSYRT